MREPSDPKRRNIPAAAATLLDRAIGYVAPRAAARRLVARQQLAVLGGYQGARKDKASLSSWRTSGGSPESDVIADLPTLRDRCADLERNAPVAASVVNSHCANVVGTGLACNPQIDAEFLGLSEEDAQAWQKDAKRRWRAWAESTDCDLARNLDFYAIQDVALRGVLSRGDLLVITPRVARDGRTRLALQLVEADRLCNPGLRANTDTMTDGVECSAATGEAIAYHVCSHYPNDTLARGSRTWTTIAARGSSTGRRNVLHLYRQLRPGLRRGVPLLAPVIEPIKQLTRYSEAELSAAVTSALMAVFLRMDPEAFQDLFDEDSRAKIVDKSSSWSGEIEAGKVINLLPGEEPVSHNPGRPNAEFDAFTTSCMRQIGMAVGMPYEVLVMHFQSSYSAARGALLMAWRSFMGWRSWIAGALCQPVYELWLADEVAEGRISAPGFFADPVVRAAWCQSQWVGDGPGSIDPAKEVGAARDRVALGISTLEAESLLHDGVDWETKHRQQVKEATARKEAGFSVPGAAQAPTLPSQPPVDDDEQTAPPPAGLRRALSGR
jgi:lambda family phage portal protein